MTQHLYRSRRVVTPQAIRPACVVVDGEKILDVVDWDDAPTGCVMHDYGEQCILPGLVDTHVHINEPGRAAWEGFETATRAAAAGGYTTLVDMPLNCLPETSTVAALQLKREAAKGKCRVDWAAWGGVVEGNQEDIEPLAAAGVPGYKCFLIYPGCDGFSMVDEAQLRAALPHVARTGLPLLVHAELGFALDAAAITLRGADWSCYATYLASRPDEAELAAIEWMIRLCRESGARIHIVHLSSAAALPMLRAARAEGLPITVETCPHYLHFCAEEIPNGATLFKCAPPIRGAANRELLWQGLRQGDIDLVATDHSPCPVEMKRIEEGNFQTAWGGIASLSVALPVMWTEMRGRGFTLVDVARWMAMGPARLAGMTGRKGCIAAGNDADFVVFDPDESFVLDSGHLHYKHPVSPYLAERLYGKVKETSVRGHMVFGEGSFPGSPLGRELVARDTGNAKR